MEIRRQYLTRAGRRGGTRVRSRPVQGSSTIMNRPSRQSKDDEKV
jgi:hypothetical protein